jgi:hypothetical protein
MNFERDFSFGSYKLICVNISTCALCLRRSVGVWVPLPAHKALDLQAIEHRRTRSHIHFAFHISPTINMSSPLADFMTGLQQHHLLSTNIAVVSDNAWIASQHAITYNGDRKPAWPSRWAAEKKTHISPNDPSRQGSITSLAPKLPSRQSSME